MPKRPRDKAAFRFHAKKVGLTYSCPTDVEDNPIPDAASLRDFLAAKFGPSKYVVAEELHENKTRHYHAYFAFDRKIDSMDVALFDFKNVHPNIISAPGPGWIEYCKKDKEFISNMATGPYATALACANADLALEHLWKTQPRDMALHGSQIEANMRKRFAPAIPPMKLWFGPYPEHYFPPKWDPGTHSLLLWGPPGTYKSQFALYLLKHTVGSNDVSFVKRDVEQLKGIKRPFVFDEINMLERVHDDSREITCVVYGGSVQARNSNAQIPPNLSRVFTANQPYPFRNPHEAVYNRRVVSHLVEFAPRPP